MARNPNDIRQKRFGRLIAVRREVVVDGRGLKKSVWHCLCDCGEVVVCERGNLLSGSSQSCGCRAKELAQQRTWKGHGEISGTYWKEVTRNAQRRLLSFTITIEECWELFLRQSRTCAITGLPIHFRKSGKDRDGQTASLDRRDSKLGYVTGNLQWVHKSANKLKGCFTREELVSMCREVVLNEGIALDRERPDWHTYFMAMAHLVSRRSIDTSTQHGCVIVDADHNVIATGYNAGPRGINDKKIPRTRPEKYSYMCHAEAAAIANAARTGAKTVGCIAYVTGRSCERCFGLLVNAGIDTVFCGNVGSTCVDEGAKQVVNHIISLGAKTKLVELEIDPTDTLLSAASHHQRYRLEETIHAGRKASCPS